MSGGHKTFPNIHTLIIHVRKNVSSVFSYFFKKNYELMSGASSPADTAALAEQFLLPVAKRLP
jgi:hypothetical protein